MKIKTIIIIMFISTNSFALTTMMKQTDGVTIGLSTASLQNQQNLIPHTTYYWDASQTYRNDLHIANGKKIQFDLSGGNGSYMYNPYPNDYQSLNLFIGTWFCLGGSPYDAPLGYYPGATNPVMRFGTNATRLESDVPTFIRASCALGGGTWSGSDVPTTGGAQWWLDSSNGNAHFAGSVAATDFTIGGNTIIKNYNFIMLASTPTTLTLGTSNFAVTEISTSSYILWANCNGIINGIRFASDLINVTGAPPISTGAYVDFISTMTGYSAPSPFVASAGSEYAAPNYPAWGAFDKINNPGKEWLCTYANLGTNSWVKIDCGTSHAARAYILIGSQNIGVAGNQIGAWTIYGSNDNSNWSTISSTSSITWSSNEEAKFFYITSPNWYRYYKILVTAKPGDQDYIGIGDWYLLE